VLAKEVKDAKESTKSVVAARAVGMVLAQRSKAAKVQSVVFDRNGFLYTGRVKALADGAREGGLEF
jgi:large subunit ribosomal protein L18